MSEQKKQVNEKNLLCNTPMLSAKHIVNAATQGAVRRHEVNQYLSGKVDKSKYKVQKTCTGRNHVVPRDNT
jgi:hypothetical protein